MYYSINLTIYAYHISIVCLHDLTSVPMVTFISIAPDLLMSEAWLVHCPWDPLDLELAPGPSESGMSARATWIYEGPQEP